MPLGIFAFPNLAEFGVEITLSLSYPPGAPLFFEDIASAHRSC
jgi:hypothetical protein